LAKYIQSQIKNDSLYLDLELESDNQRLSDAENFLKNNQEKTIIIDEIQRMPSLFALLRALVDIKRQAGRFILLGSASPSIIKNSSESLAGRISYNELTPFSWLEISDKYSLIEHWLRGGFPQSLMATQHEQSKRWLKSFIQTFINRDLQELGHKISYKTITNLLRIIASINGNILNISDLSRSLGIAKPTVEHYLDLLEGGFIISRLQPFHINITKRIVKSPKIYIRDSGILHNLLNIDSYDQLQGNNAIGASWEGYVIEQIKRILGDNWQLYFYRTHKGAEADLVMVGPSGKKICLEIKLSNTMPISRGFYETIEDIKPDYSFIVTQQGDSYSKANNILVCNFDEFLQDKILKY